MADTDEATEDRNTSSSKLEEVHERAIRRFDACVLPQLELRELALIARRFVNIPGAQWEGEFGSCFPDEIKMEIPLIKEGIDKIKRDYNSNRIVPDFRPSGDKGNDESASNLSGIHRADAYHFKSSQAWDNAFSEAVDGGMGAYRLANEWADASDPDNDHQRINPGIAIVDADQRVFFGPSILYDKSDAPYAYVITAHDRLQWEEDHEGAIANWPEGVLPQSQYDWYRPDVVKVAEYYEVEEVNEKLYVCTHKLSGQEDRYWDSEIEDDELAQMKKMGWTIKAQNRKRKRVHKYLMSGTEVLSDKGLIAGTQIPVVPVYGKRAYVDGVERFEGYTQSKMDIQRLYNTVVSRLAETSTQSPREIPIFAREQMPPNIAELWKNQVRERHAFAVVEPLRNEAGDIVSAGPIGKVDAPQISSVDATLLQLVRTDLTENQEDGADEVKANVSEEAMNVAATRVDARSGIYLDNMRQSVQRGGEVYVSMGSDVYYEPERVVDTMDDDGNESTVTLVQQSVDPKGVTQTLNDFSYGHYKVIVSVTEATATRRDKTVKTCLNLAEIATAAQNIDLANVSLFTAVMNMDGEGMDDMSKWARQRLITLNVVTPSDEEKAQIDKATATAQQQPDPNAIIAQAKAEDLAASAKQRGADTVLKLAQAQAVGGPEAAPQVPDGLEAAHKVVQIRKDAATAANMETQTAHLPQKLAIEANNSRANAIKAQASAHSARFAALGKMFGGGKKQ